MALSFWFDSRLRNMNRGLRPLGLVFQALLLARFILTVILYSLVMITITLDFRNQVMVSNAILRIEANNYERILFSCGSSHAKELARLFREKGFEVEEIKGYQKLLPWF